jgi:hypothetical protein
MQKFNHVEHGITLPQMIRETTESGRKYFTPEGNAYPSITTVLSILGKKELMEWRRRVGEEEANKISRRAASRGTAVHKMCEDYLDNKEDWKGKHQPINVFLFQTLQPLLDEKINNIWFQESHLYSDTLRTAGQVDCIAEFENELSVIDFKTSTRPKKAESIMSYFMQAAFYAAAFYERTSTPIKRAVILIAVENSEPQIFKVDTFEYLRHFISVRKTYKELYEKDKVYNSR